MKEFPLWWVVGCAETEDVGYVETEDVGHVEVEDVGWVETEDVGCVNGRRLTVGIDVDSEVYRDDHFGVDYDIVSLLRYNNDIG
jgi:hypothetical protein